MPGKTKYEEIAGKVAALINSGVLQVEQRIPSLRAMSNQSGTSVMTVMQAYRLLEDQGMIESRPQSGYYVRHDYYRQRPAAFMPEAQIQPLKTEAEEVRISSIIEKLVKPVDYEHIIPLGSGLQDSSFYPSEQLSIHLSRVIRSDPAGLNCYCFEAGHEALRWELARRMIEAGCNTSPEEIIVSAGASQALYISLKTLTKPGDAIAVESPGYYGFYALMERLQLRAVEIPCDPQTGLSLSALETVLQRDEDIRCVLLSANLSNPTGASIPEHSKQIMADLCKKHRVPIIEDDVYGELAFALLRPRALKSYDPENIIYVGSMSKTLAPGYRIGWIAAGKYQQQVLDYYRCTVMSATLPTQMAVASFLKSGGMAHHLRRMHKAHRENMLNLQNKIAASFPNGTRISNPLGGYFIWVELPEPVDSVILAERLLKQNISIAPGIIFSVGGHYRNFMRLNCALQWGPRLESAIEAIAAEVKRF